MRELVYLSETKLQAFMIKRRRRWLGRAQIAAEVGLPGIGGLKIGSEAPSAGYKSTQTLDEVIDALLKSKRAPRSFEDDFLRPGEWVEFRVRLSFTQHAGTVLFLNTGELNGDGVVQRRRLFLHGASRHLLASAGGVGTSATSRADAKLLRMFRINDPRLRFSFRYVDGSSYSHESHGVTSINRMVDSLESLLSLERTSAWMAGYARVSAIAPLTRNDGIIVVASPLYVEYAPSPDRP